ncbi:monovalent cation/H+ antiporter subunit D [Comamonas serinivorans]|uniref:Monovalent cation/H+ antiporter subunit D n=1 Tax=Comamonas serinivorans TaxID=1082851 RepID=A0A1Y0EKY8_9BURK|nr:monovalent cation/H+ antiporter subunit D [Comamonas serinivorans]ARU04295.1 monovalent cation/H+ antiporter subunit D [Comamonas serinivorans]
MNWLDALMPHLVVAPILLPMFTAALLLFPGEQARTAKSVVNLLSCLLGLAIAIFLVYWVHRQNGVGAIGVYLPSNWQVPFGIVLAVDRLSALMLLMTSIIGLGSLMFSVAGWDRAGVHFHSLFQLQLMGLNGAFLTADLFNLFVFFEIMLTASYGLLLHGTGWPRVRSGLHYITMNLLASFLFLLGIALLYGVTGTLNMADMALKIPLIPAGDRGLLHAGAAVLAVAFLAKAAAWPLNFWLPPAYAAACPPVSALFAIMTKVGLYAILRLWTLLFPPTAVGSALFGSEVLVWGGLATLGFASIGVLASTHLQRLVGFSVLVSSGTLLAAFGFSHSALTGGALYYLMSSTLALAALFLVTDLIERSRQTEEAVPEENFDDEQFPFPIDLVPPEHTNLDEQEQALIGKAIPAAMAFLGMSFMLCALLVSGLPPMSGFIGKAVMLTAVLNPEGLAVTDAVPRSAAWVMLALVIVSGLMATVSFSRAGIRFFWAPHDRAAPRLRVIECLPIVAMLAVCVLLVARAEPVLRYTDLAARALHDPRDYIRSVMAAQTVKEGHKLPAAGTLEGKP